MSRQQRLEQNAGRDECRTREPARRNAERKRRQRRKQSAGRDETRLERETQSKRTTSNDSLKLELVRRTLLFRESATAFVVLQVENDLHKHANGYRNRRTSSVSSAAHSSSSRANCKRRAYDNTAYSLNIFWEGEQKLMKILLSTIIINVQSQTCWILKQNIILRILGNFNKI